MTTVFTLRTQYYMDDRCDSLQNRLRRVPGLLHALDSHGRLDRWAALSIGSNSAALVPLDKLEVFSDPAYTVSTNGLKKSPVHRAGRARPDF